MVNHQRGFTLVEVLVASLLLAIGLLGVASLQTSGVRYQHHAYLQTQATLLSNDMIDRMRANRAGDATYHLAHLNPSYNPNHGYPICRSVTGCSAQQLVYDDLWAWQQAIAALLPDSVGLVCIDSTPEDGTGAARSEHQCDDIGDTYVVKIWWRSNHSQHGALQQHTVRVQL